MSPSLKLIRLLNNIFNSQSLVKYFVKQYFQFYLNSICAKLNLLVFKNY